MNSSSQTFIFRHHNSTANFLKTKKSIYLGPCASNRWFDTRFEHVCFAQIKSESIRKSIGVTVVLPIIKYWLTNASSEEVSRDER